MKKVPALSQELIEQLRGLDSATVANAVERFEVRLPNAGFNDPRMHCMFPDLPPMVGYAATVRIRAAAPPMEARAYIDRWDWLKHVLDIPEPRVLVVEDLDEHPGQGAFVGQMHANILCALGCAGVVTNGAVRGLPAGHEIGLQMFAGSVSVSHAYAHVLDFGGPVIVGRMKVHPGDLLHGDLHGVQTIPIEIADKIPGAASQIVQFKRNIAKLCRSGSFTLDQFYAAIEDGKP